MARNRYIKTHSNYVIKDIHQTTNIGKIYERDFMTISDLNSYAPGSLPAYELNGFKMVVSDGVNLKKKHRYGNWVKNPHSNMTTDNWILEDIDEVSDSITNFAEIKPNIHSVLDYSCFGSSYKLIETTIKNIIKTFPGELVLTDTKINIDGNVLYLVDNPFNIEMDRHLLLDEQIENPLRVFSESYDKYIFNYENKTYSLSWKLGELNQNPCRYEGDELSNIELEVYTEKVVEKPLKMSYYIYGGKKVLCHDGTYMHGTITPNVSIRRDFFKNLKGFEKVLLNKKTNYTAILDTPKETEYGNVTYKKSYTWPKSKYGDWNIDVNSEGFLNYFNSLLLIGEFYDDFFSDNIWRAMTHEAIINFDWTLTTVDGDGVITEMETPHSDRIKAFVQVAGRQFDDLKQYIDGISNSNSVTYNECGNNPDRYLTDSLVNYGWETRVPLSTELSKFNSYSLYPGHVEGYTAQDANNEFFRRLLLNSSYILSSKGTKRSIEMIMALFGYYSFDFLKHTYHEMNRGGNISNLKWNELTVEEQNRLKVYGYDMNEYVYIAGDGSSLYNGGNVDIVKEKNKYKLTYDYNSYDDYQGLPVREVTTFLNGEEITYLIPWFDKKTAYDGNIYFENKGGWGLKESIRIGDNVLNTNDDLKIYDETVKYLKFIESEKDLPYITYEYPQKGDIYYTYDEGKYYILENEEYSNIVGEDTAIDEDGNEIQVTGWKLLTNDDPRIIYLESIIESNVGNNPHCGYGQYDCGAEYEKNFKDIFYGTKKEDLFVDTSDTIVPADELYGFNVEKQVDNVKCWYFTDTTVSERQLSEEYGGKYIVPSVGIGKYVRKTYMEPYNMEGGEEDDEASANSIINTKQFSIDFVPDLISPMGMFDFIDGIIMHYVKQVIPSTTILKYNVPMTDREVNCYHSTYINSAIITE